MSNRLYWKKIKERERELQVEEFIKKHGVEKCSTENYPYEHRPNIQVNSRNRRHGLRDSFSQPDYKKYIKSKKWDKKREHILKTYGEHCEICNSDDRVCVHHNTYVSFPKEPDGDLIVLCRRCHYEFHQRIADQKLRGVISDTQTKKCHMCSTTNMELRESTIVSNFKRSIILCASCIAGTKTKNIREFKDIFRPGRRLL